MVLADPLYHIHCPLIGHADVERLQDGIHLCMDSAKNMEKLLVVSVMNILAG